jgi:hypothetical protein
MGDEEMERNAKYSHWRVLIVLHGFTREHKLFPTIRLPQPLFSFTWYGLLHVTTPEIQLRNYTAAAYISASLQYNAKHVYIGLRYNSKSLHKRHLPSDVRRLVQSSGEDSRPAVLSRIKIRRLIVRSFNIREEEIHAKLR